MLVPCTCEVSSELAAIESGDPLRDAAQAVAMSQLSFVGIMGYSVKVPGVDDWSLVEKFGVRIVEGTSDVVRCYEQARLTMVATAYAEAYNREILKAIDDR